MQLLAPKRRPFRPTWAKRVAACSGPPENMPRVPARSASDSGQFGTNVADNRAEDHQSWARFGLIELDDAWYNFGDLAEFGQHIAEIGPSWQMWAQLRWIPGHIWSMSAECAPHLVELAAFRQNWGKHRALRASREHAQKMLSKMLYAKRGAENCSNIADKCSRRHFWSDFWTPGDQIRACVTS